MQFKYSNILNVSIKRLLISSIPKALIFFYHIGTQKKWDYPLKIISTRTFFEIRKWIENIYLKTTSSSCLHVLQWWQLLLYRPQNTHTHTCVIYYLITILGHHGHPPLTRLLHTNWTLVCFFYISTIICTVRYVRRFGLLLLWKDFEFLHCIFTLALFF